ncbi:MAG: hypothetical protein J6R15_01475 [Bacteroidales bacterium]|nr:hypothetical protein [Bacteroidales bacterium]
MKIQNFGLLYFLMVLGQMVLCNFADFSPFVMLTMLPAMVICVPLSVSTPACMLLAFATGLSVDWLSEGLIGINAASLVPVALMRKPLIRFFLGEDIITRSDSFSFRKNGLSKISFILIISTLIFLSIYVFLDGAGTRPAWFNLTRTGASLACDLILALIVTGILTTDDRR